MAGNDRASELVCREGDILKSFFKEKIYRNEDYLQFLKKRPCSILGLHRCLGDIIPHHTSVGGKGLKGPDLHSIPLCHGAHNEHDHIGKVTFYKKYGVDRWEIVAKALVVYVESLESGGVDGSICNKKR